MLASTICRKCLRSYPMQHTLLRLTRLRHPQVPHRLFRHRQGSNRPLTGPVERLATDPGLPPAGWSSLARPLLFTVGFAGVSFCGAAIWQYENMRTKAKSVWKHQREAIQEQMEQFRDSPVFSSVFSEKKAGRWREELNKYWNKMPESDKVFLPILALNIGVFLAWRVPSLQKVMLRYFASNPSSRNTCWPMLLSSFSHYSFFHLFANMYVLHSFSGPIVKILGKEQFVGLYLSAAVVSAFCSNVAKVATGRVGFSLGASGAIMTVIGIFGTLLPDAKMQIIFLPMLSFTAGAAIKAIMALDTVGMIAGWQFFDHAAHLGGVLFGIWWVKQGNALIWNKREVVMRFWHENIRGDDRRKPPKI